MCYTQTCAYKGVNDFKYRESDAKVKGAAFSRDALMSFTNRIQISSKGSKILAQIK